MENPIEMDDLEVPLFLETSIHIYIYMRTCEYKCIGPNSGTQVGCEW